MTKDNLELLFPSRIKDLTLVHQIKDIVARSEYHFASYQDTSGKKYVAKLLKFSRKNKSYLGLKNEISVYQALTQVLKQHRTTINKQFPNVSVPSLYFHSENSNQLLMVIEYASGKLLTKQSDQLMVNAYEHLIAYFHFISRFITKSGKKITTRSLAIHLIFFYVYFLIAVLKNLKFLPELLHAFITYHKGLFSRGEKNNFVLVHRDLGGYNNVLVDKQSLSVIDFQLTCLTHPLVEIANIIATRWRDQSFIQLFLSSPTISHILSQPHKKALLKSFLIHAAVFDLASGEGRPTTDSLAMIRKVQSL